MTEVRATLAAMALGLFAACSPACDTAQTNSAPKSAASAATATIPDPFRGVWDYVEGTCAPESDLRLDVQPSAVTFYATHGEVIRVDMADPFEMWLDLAMSGEGEEWTQSLGFYLRDGGRRLEILDPDRPASNNILIRKRCSS